MNLETNALKSAFTGNLYNASSIRKSSIKSGALIKLYILQLHYQILPLLAVAVHLCFSLLLT